MVDADPTMIDGAPSLETPIVEDGLEDLPGAPVYHLTMDRPSPSTSVSSSTQEAPPAASHPSEDATTYRLAVTAVIVSSLLNSCGGVLIRSIEEASPWQIVSLRAGALAASLFIVFSIRSRGHVRHGFLLIGGWGVLGAGCLAVANICFVQSLENTTVANTLFVLSSTPLVTAVLARIFLGERVRKATWLAMAVSAVGIVLMIGDGLAAGTGFGNLMAIVTVFGFSSFLVVLRRGRAVNMLPAVIMGAFLSSCISTAVAGGDLALPLSDAAICLGWGGLLGCFVHVLFTFGSRHVQGAELALLVLLEFVLGPIWVWIFVGEEPTRMTLIGGAIVLSSVAGRALVLARAR